jgi:hypothetical protein
LKFVYPGSRIRLFSIPEPNLSIPDPGSASKNLSILTQKNGFLTLGNMIRVVQTASRIRILTFYPSRIPDPGVKKAPDPGSGSATLVDSLLTQLQRCEDPFVSSCEGHGFSLEPRCQERIQSGAENRHPGGVSGSGKLQLLQGLVKASDLHLGKCRKQNIN